MRQRFILILMLVFCLGFGGIAHAQDTTPTDPPPTEVPTEAPVVAPTDIPTAIPTDIPTEVPTDIPTAIPTEVPTNIPTVTPLASTSPVFNLANGTVFDVVVGSSLTINLSVADTTGSVTVVGSSNVSAASVQVTVTVPVETSAPFNTALSVVYTPATGFTGTDVITLTAVDAANVTSTLTINVNVGQPNTPVPATPLPTAAPTKTLLINYSPTASEAAIKALLAQLGAIEVKRIPQIGAMEVLVPNSSASGANAMASIANTAAARAAGFSSAEENGQWSIFQDAGANFVPNDTSWTDPGQWGLKNSTAGAWVQTGWDWSPTRGSGVIVAVIDTGVWAAHPDLSGQVLAGYDFVNDDADASDDYGHGTHVAGTIAAKTNNALGVAGIAYKAKILPVKVLNSTGYGDFFVIAQGIIYSVDKGAKIINMSLGANTYSTTIAGAVNYALSKGVVVIASAGNDSSTNYAYPASYDGVISVAAHDSSGNHAAFSQANDRVTLSAPGVGILSTMLTTGGVLTNSTGYGLLDGTSMAAPHVAGVAALIISSGVATTPRAVREALVCGARDLSGLVFTNQMGFGLLDADFSMRWHGNSSSCQIPQPNDDFEKATVISALPYSTTQAVQAKSVTSQYSDPTNCGPGNVPFSNYQTLWYKYVPTVSGYYQFSTFGSSFDTAVAVYRGTTAGALANVDCNDDWVDTTPGYNSKSFLAAQLVAGQTYYIDVAKFGGADNQVLQLNIRLAMETLNLDYQNNAPQIAYSGTWATVAQTGASGGTITQTTDDSAVAHFSYKGSYIELGYMVGPLQGDTEVWIDGVLTTVLPGRAALTTVKSRPLSLGNAGIHRIALKRSTSGPAGAITIDRVRVFNDRIGTAVTALTDDRDSTRIRYTGSWTQGSQPGANANTVSFSSTEGDSISFLARGSAVTIYRTTGVNSGFGSATIYVDNIYYGLMDNDVAAGVKVPYIISGLAPTDHVISIVVNGFSYLEFDAVLPSSPAPITAKVDERSPSVFYSGIWTNQLLTGAFTNGTRYSDDMTSLIEFQFTGNILCMGYLQETGGANYSVSIDNKYVDTIVSNGSYLLKNWCSHTSPTSMGGNQVFFTGLHKAQILRTTAGRIELDYIQPMTYNIITPARGTVQENDAAISYSGLWGTATSATFGPTGPFSAGPIHTGAKSLGGYVPSGGSLRRTYTDGAAATFFINGTGFILYSAVGPGQGCAQVYIDGIKYPFTDAGIARNGIDLSIQSGLATTRYRPFSFGVTDLLTGIHKIQLVADSDCSSFSYGFSPIYYFDFDAVRVFP